MKSETFRKQALSLIVFFVAVAAVFFLAERMRADPAGKQAQFIVTQLLSGTGAAEPAADLSAASGSEPGIVSADDSGLVAFYRAQFADCMTDDCLNTLLANRLPTRIASLAQQQGDSLEPTALQLHRRTGDAVCFRFSADLQTVGGKNIVGTASGTITMVKEDGVWKASAVTLTVS